MAFKPHYRFVYNDAVFVKNNISKLIPGGIELTRFHEDDFEDIDPYIIRAAILLSTDGFPPHVEKIISEVHEHAIEHLDFFMSDCVSDVLYEGMEYDSEDFSKWRVLLITLMLSRWFTKDAALRILIHTPRCLNPLGILKSDVIAAQFEGAGVTAMVKRYLQQENLSIVKAQRLVAKLRLFGYTDQFFKVFNPHDYINYGPAMEVITKYSSLKTKDGDKLAATLMTIYFPETSIDDALKA